MRAGMREAAGIVRSLAVYRGRARHGRGLVRLYRGFVGPGDLVFDVGAHVGDRIAAFRTIGARVVALEPNGRLFPVLRLLHGRDRGVTLVKAAAGPASGRATLRINTKNPTVSTLSDGFVADARDAAGWREQVWDASAEVDVVALDDLVAAHGAPAFVKIDVEGFEAEALAGLTRPPPALSFEITTMARAAGLAALDRAAALGFDRFRLSLGESHSFTDEGWVSAEAMRRRIQTLPDAANSGDVYAVGDGFARPLPG